MLDATKVINGTYGQVFLGDDEVAEMKAFQAKLEFQKEEIKVAGQMATDTKLMSYSGKGSLQLHKVNSRMVKTLLEEIKAGKDPRFTLIGKLADPNSNGAERLAIKNGSSINKESKRLNVDFITVKRAIKRLEDGIYDL